MQTITVISEAKIRSDNINMHGVTLTSIEFELR